MKGWDAVSGTLRCSTKDAEVPGLAQPGIADYPGMHPEGESSSLLHPAPRLLSVFFFFFSANLCFPINCSFLMTKEFNHKFISSGISISFTSLAPKKGFSLSEMEKLNTDTPISKVSSFSYF